MWYTSLTPVDTNVNLIVPEERQRSPATPSLSQHLEFIYQWDKHKYSHIILRKRLLNTSHTPCCQRLGGLSPACTDRMREIGLLEMTFLPADCKDCYVTTHHLLKVVKKKRGEERKRADWDQTFSCSAPTFYQCWHFSVLYHVRMWFWKCATDVEVLKLEKRFERVFFGCFGFLTWIDPDILCKWQACAHVHAHTNPEMNQRQWDKKHHIASFIWLV